MVHIYVQVALYVSLHFHSHKSTSSTQLGDRPEVVEQRRHTESYGVAAALFGRSSAEIKRFLTSVGKVMRATRMSKYISLSLHFLSQPYQKALGFRSFCDLSMSTHQETSSLSY